MVERLQRRRADLPTLKTKQGGKEIRNSRRWKATSKHHRMMHPVCEACGFDLADEVHHRIPVSVSPSLAFDPSNLMALCRACHRVAHSRQAKGAVELPPATPPRIELGDCGPRSEAILAEGRERADRLIG